MLYRGKSHRQAVTPLPWIFCRKPLHTILQRICNEGESLGSQTCISTSKTLSLRARDRGKGLAFPLTGDGSVDRAPLRASVTEVHKMWLTHGSCWQHDASMRGRDSSVLSPWRALSRDTNPHHEVQSFLRRASWDEHTPVFECFKALLTNSA